MIRGRPFEPGNQFGRGRPPGSRNKRSKRAQQWLEQYGEPLMQKALALALQGDAPLLRMLLSYLLRRPADRPVETGPLRIGSGEELAQTSANVLNRVASGKLSLSDAQAVAALLEGRRRALQTEALEKRAREHSGAADGEGLTVADVLRGRIARFEDKEAAQAEAKGAAETEAEPAESWEVPPESDELTSE